MAVPKELLEKKAKLAEETNRVTSELQEVFAALGDLDEQQQLQVQLQSKQLVCFYNNRMCIFLLELNLFFVFSFLLKK